MAQDKANKRPRTRTNLVHDEYYDEKDDESHPSSSNGDPPVSKCGELLGVDVRAKLQQVCCQGSKTSQNN